MLLYSAAAAVGILGVCTFTSFKAIKAAEGSVIKKGTPTVEASRENEEPAGLPETGEEVTEGAETGTHSESSEAEAVEETAPGEKSKVMYLTFDDGPSAENTTRVLDILKARNIKATFFVVGENVRKNPEVAKRIVAEGHGIGIHCNRHDYNALYQSRESYIQDFEEAYQAVLETTGVEAKLFRFPGGSVNAYNKRVNQSIIEEMTARGFIYFDWNASLEDSVRKSEPEELIATAVETSMGRKKVVLLAHDIVYNTTMCLEDLIDSFPEYRMEVLTPDVEPIQFRR